MEIKGQEEKRLDNHNFILNFLVRSQDLTDELSESMKATMSQFLDTVRKDVNRLGFVDDGYIPQSDIYQVQINNLRKCIVDLEHCVNITLSGRKTVQ